MKFPQLTLLALIVASLVGCQSETLTPDPAATNNPTQSAGETEKADEQTQSEDNETTTGKEIYIDVRSQAEWDEEHLEGTKLIPHLEIAEKIGDVTEDKAAKIVVFCKMGGRAGQAKKALEDLGYTNVENAGGLADAKKRLGQ